MIPMLTLRRVVEAITFTDGDEPRKTPRELARLVETLIRLEDEDRARQAIRHD